MHSIRCITKAVRPAVQIMARRNLPKTNIPTRFFAAHATPSSGDDVVIPEIVNSLEWTLETPLSVHQFDEPPIIVEIEHLDNLIVGAH
eukprot:gene12492-26299_t